MSWISNSASADERVRNKQRLPNRRRAGANSSKITTSQLRRNQHRGTRFLMKLLRLLAAVILALQFLPWLLGQSSGPDDRKITDPQSARSATNSRARAIPFDDLYYTRSVSSPSWSPDGKQILFTTDITGRSNLWKVSSAGGWPIQLVQSDERQYGGTWSPDGKWIAFTQDTAGNELWDIFAVPS